MSLRVLAESLYPTTVASTRVRLCQHSPFLEAAGLRFDFQSVLSDADYQTLLGDQGVPRKTAVVARCLTQLVTRRRRDYDVQVVHRTRWPLAQPAADPLRAVDIYDFDDALHLGPGPLANRSFARLGGDRGWRAYVRRATLVVAGNRYLADAARQYNRRVEIIPSCVDPARYPVREHTDREHVTVGWIGSRSTAPYLRPVIEVMERLVRRRPELRLVVIGAELGLDRPWLRCQPWAFETEGAALAGFDIGVMPLGDGEWARGKCGYKLLQYLAAGLPAIASAVGVNHEILGGGMGTLVGAFDDWETAIEELADDLDARRELGRRGRELVEREYSYERWSPLFADLIHSAAS